MIKYQQGNAICFFSIYLKQQCLPSMIGIINMMQNIDNRESQDRIHPAQLQVPQPQPPLNINNNQQRDRQHRQRMRSYFGMIATQQNLHFIEQNKVLFFSGKTQITNPQKEGYFMMLKQNLFPHLKWYSLSFILIYLSTIVFIIQASIGFYNHTFLQIDNQTYTKMGVNSSKLVYRGQVYRLIVSIFLHVNLIHLVSNMFCLMLILPIIQHTFDWIRTLAVYLCTGIAGNIFSDLLAPDAQNTMIKLGASNSLYGMIGLSLGYLIINWAALDIIGPLFRFKMILIIFLAAIFMIMFTDQASNVDYVGHLGGFMTGVFISAFMPSLKLTTCEIRLRIVLGIFFVAMILCCFLIFYLAPQDSYSH